MPNQQNQQLIRSYIDAINSHDVNKVVGLFTPDAEFKNLGFDQVFRGTQELNEMVQGWFRAFPDVKLEMVAMGASDDVAFAEHMVKGTHQGVFSTELGDFDATQMKINVPTCDIFKFRNGKISSIHCYVESLVLLHQIGVSELKAAA